MNCNLCKYRVNESNRCNSHIFPKALLKLLPEYSYGNLLMVGTDMKRKKRAPIGSYDDSILCRDCDNSLGVYDQYASEFIGNSELINHESGLGWIVKGVDRRKLKLFCISYLWRASITNREEFKGVNLGSKHENKMREMLKDSNPGEINDYTVVFSKFDQFDDNFAGIMLPARTRINERIYYEAYLPKLFKFWIKVDSQPDEVAVSLLPNYEDDLFIHNKGNFNNSDEKKIITKAARKSE